MDQRRSIVFILAATIGYGLMPIFTTIAYRAQITPAELVLLRMLGSALFLIIFLSIRKNIRSLKLPVKTVRTIVVNIGIPFTLTILFKFLAFLTMPVGVVQAIFYGYPIVVIVISVLTGREKFRMSTVIGYSIIFIGIILTLDFSDTRITVLGTLLSFASTLIYGWYILSIKNKLILPVPSFTITTYVTLAGTVIMLMVLPFFQTNNFRFESSGWLGIAGLIFVSTIGAFMAFNYGAKFVASSIAAIVLCFEPIATVIFELLLIGGHYTPRQYIGIVLIPMGIIFALLLAKRPGGRAQLART
jgi:drug/metabolite transporter (DMT)-like permease